MAEALNAVGAAELPRGSSEAARCRGTAEGGPSACRVNGAFRNNLEGVCSFAVQYYMASYGSLPGQQVVEKLTQIEFYDAGGLHNLPHKTSDVCVHASSMDWCPTGPRSCNVAASLMKNRMDPKSGIPNRTDGCEL